MSDAAPAVAESDQQPRTARSEAAAKEPVPAATENEAIKLVPKLHLKLPKVNVVLTRCDGEKKASTVASADTGLAGLPESANV